MLWQSKGAAGEPKQPSSWLQRLYKNHVQQLSQTIEFAPISFKPISIKKSFAKLPDNFPRPEYVSPSAYRALRECPYRYYATRLLKLRAKDGLDSEVDLSLVGQTLHAALRSFYNDQKTNPIVISDGLERKNFLIKKLRDLSARYFQPLLDADGRWLAAWVEWELHLEDWINWQLEREKRGWIFHDAEKSVGFILDTKFGGISVTGFVDRIDVHPTEGASVIDYKYSSRESIKKKEKNIDDDPQLVIYAKAINCGDLIGGQPVVDASWVSLKDLGVELAVGDLVNHMDALPSQMIADIEEVWGGSAMYANAPDSICQYCQVRGICRKGMWS
jgi:ATP-dependent helicase/nuclease subunit B